MGRGILCPLNCVVHLVGVLTPLVVYTGGSGFLVVYIIDGGDSPGVGGVGHFCGT